MALYPRRWNPSKERGIVDFHGGSLLASTLVFVFAPCSISDDYADDGGSVYLRNVGRTAHMRMVQRPQNTISGHVK
jgi:hypothetical protein